MGNDPGKKKGGGGGGKKRTTKANKNKKPRANIKGRRGKK